MKKLITLAIVLLLGCATEPIDEPLKEGYLSYKGTFIDLTASRIPVPECSGFTPNEVFYHLIRPDNGQEFQRTSAISLQGNNITALDQILLPTGTYSVEEVSLRYNGIVTHTAPTDLGPGEAFASYTDKPLPYNIEINTDQTTTLSDRVLCYTEEVIDLNAEFEWVGDVLDLETLYFYIPEGSCIDLVTLKVDSYRLIEWRIFDFGLHAIPIPAEFSQYTLNGYNEESAVIGPDQTFEGTEYNPDGVLDQDDILFFDLNCQF